jgi:ribosomal-protein-alanine N-acetyltransferase
MTHNDGDARVRLRPLAPDDQDEFIAQARASTGLHHPWYTMPTTPEAFQAYLAKYSQPTAEGWLVCLRDSGALAGMIIIDSIVRGRFQSATLSYAAFAPAAGRGYMSEGLALVLRHAFCELRLHRLEANIQPANQPSLRLGGPAPHPARPLRLTAAAGRTETPDPPRQSALDPGFHDGCSRSGSP